MLRLGWGARQLERKDFLAALDQKLVKITVVYPHFAEEKKLLQTLNTHDK